MLVERDTGARHYFAVPLAHACEIYREAIQQVSGIARTARGPSLSASPGKVEIQGTAEINGEKVFVLRFLQGRIVGPQPLNMDHQSPVKSTCGPNTGR